jgi:sugar/nucleoside kinase (ribokinase family)
MSPGIFRLSARHRLLSVGLGKIAWAMRFVRPCSHGRWMYRACNRTRAIRPTVQIAIEQGEPSYEIVPAQAYDFIAADELTGAQSDGLLYHGTLALRHDASRRALETLKARHKSTLFMDVNLREPWWNKDEVLKWVGDTDWVKLNHHELQALHPGTGDMNADIRAFRAEHGLKGLVVTCGKQGALARSMRTTKWLRSHWLKP